MNRCIIFTFAAVLSISSFAATIGYSHPDPRAERTPWGTGRAETYDIAIKIDEKSFGGKTVSSLTMPLTEGASPRDGRGWLSSSLNLTADGFAPDVVSVEAVKDGDMLTVSFPDGYMIPEDGLYAGFTFTIEDIAAEADKYPVSVAEGASDGGLWIHSSYSYTQWFERSAALGSSSMISAFIDGDFPAGDIEATFSGATVVAGSSAQLPITLVSFGCEEVNSVEYEYYYTGTDLKGEGTYVFTSPLPAYYGLESTAIIDLRTPADVGQYECGVRITSVNGNPNVNVSPVGLAFVDAVPFMPVTRPLMEEFTGLWCAYCPKGYIALERMDDLYPDLFVGVSYHNASSSSKKEVMQAFDKMPLEIDYYPRGVFNRVEKVDPYYGRVMNQGFTIPEIWEEYAGRMAPADIEAELNWDGNAASDIEVRSRVRFVKPHFGASYRIAYILVADGLHGPEDKSAPGFSDWLQANNYSGITQMESEGEDWKLFTEAPGKVAGLIFNDVAVAATSFEGVPGSLPADLTAGEWYDHAYSFKASEVRNVYDESFLLPDVSLRCVAVIIDGGNGGEAVNCVSTQSVGIVSKIDLPVSRQEKEVILTDVSGLPVGSGYKGICFRTTIYSDGSRLTEKIVR